MVRIVAAAIADVSPLGLTADNVILMVASGQTSLATAFSLNAATQTALAGRLNNYIAAAANGQAPAYPNATAITSDLIAGCTVFSDLSAIAEYCALGIAGMVFAILANHMGKNLAYITGLFSHRIFDFPSYDLDLSDTGDVQSIWLPLTTQLQAAFPTSYSPKLTPSDIASSASILDLMAKALNRALGL